MSHDHICPIKCHWCKFGESVTNFPRYRAHTVSWWNGTTRRRRFGNAHSAQAQLDAADSARDISMQSETYWERERLNEIPKKYQHVFHTTGKVYNIHLQNKTYRCRRGGREGGTYPQKFWKNFSGKWQTCGHFDNFSGKYQVKFEHFVDFSYIISGQMFWPPKLTELLRLRNKITNSEFKFKSNPHSS